VIVVDASVVVAAVAGDGPDGHHARKRLSGEVRIAPHVLDVEVLRAVRGLAARAVIPAARAHAAVVDLARLDIGRVPHRALLPRAWELRRNLTAYDAVYVALAEIIGVPLVTADARLARAPGVRCAVEVLATPT